MAQKDITLDILLFMTSQVITANRYRQAMLKTSSPKYFLSIISLLLLFMGGCARLPDYAQPHFKQNTEPLSLNVITYRSLARADFQAKELPPHLQAHRKRLNAHTAAAIRPASASKIFISSALLSGQRVYSARVEQVVFEAVMIPEKSWWNPHLEKGMEDYVLQHEQIHFALMEIAARHLSARVARENPDLTVFDFSYQAAQKTLMERVNDLIAETRADLLKDHTTFDEDASMRYSPKAQQRWWKKVTEQLQNSADR